MATGPRKLGGVQENRRRHSGFNKVSWPPWWLIDIFWHLLPCSAVIDSSCRPRSRKGWERGMGAALIDLYGKQPCLVIAVLWPQETGPCGPRERWLSLYPLPPLPGRMAWHPETWRWIRIHWHPPKKMSHAGVWESQSHTHLSPRTLSLSAEIIVSWAAAGQGGKRL